MRDWLSRQYNDIKGNAKYSLLIALWWAVTWVANKLLHYIPNIPNWTIWATLLLLSAAAFVWIAKSIGRPKPLHSEHYCNLIRLMGYLFDSSSPNMLWY